MAFVQIIEFTTTRIDEIRQLLDEVRSSTEGTRAVARGIMCKDRDEENRYLNIVEFESYEAAMKNSELPETSAFAEKMAQLCDEPPTFRNLDVREVLEG